MTDQMAKVADMVPDLITNAQKNFTSLYVRPARRCGVNFKSGAITTASSVCVSEDFRGGGEFIDLLDVLCLFLPCLKCVEKRMCSDHCNEYSNKKIVLAVSIIST